MRILFMLLSSYLLAGDMDVSFGRSVPQEIWDIREQPEREIYDAVILKDITRFTSGFIKRYREVRILNENGKTAAELIDPVGRVQKLKGRVVDITGKETKFDKKEDFVEVLNFRARGRSSKGKILIPPGLTTDCLVEYSWQIPSVSGLPLGRRRQQYQVQEEFFCMKKSFLVERLAFSSQSFSLSGTSIDWTGIAPPAKFEKAQTSKLLELHYLGTPAKEDFPFGNQHLDPSSASVLVFRTLPDDYTKTPDAFWSRFGKVYLKDLFDGSFSKSAGYKAWIEDIKSEMPRNPRGCFYACRECLSFENLLYATDVAGCQESLYSGFIEQRGQRS